MSWTALNPNWTKPAVKQLAKLPSDVRVAVEAAVNRYAATGVGDVRALKVAGDLALRVRDYRVKFVIVVTVHEMTIQAVLHRKEAYD